MRSLQQLIRARKLELDDRRKEATRIEGMLRELERQALRMDEVEREEVAQAENVPFGLGAPPQAWRHAHQQQRRHLAARQEDVEHRLDAAREAVRAGFDTLKRLEQAAETIAAREALEAKRREAIKLDELALNLYRRSRAAQAG